VASLFLHLALPPKAGQNWSTELLQLVRTL
jgi:hypothetical protein